jgi:hypothetical protein
VEKVVCCYEASLPTAQASAAREKESVSVDLFARSKLEVCYLRLTYLPALDNLVYYEEVRYQTFLATCLDYCGLG